MDAPGPSPTTSPKPDLTVPASSEAHNQDPTLEDRVAESPGFASPARSPSPTQKPASPVHSPALGSGTKEDEVQINGSLHAPTDKPSTVVAKVLDPEV